MGNTLNSVATKMPTCGNGPSINVLPDDVLLEIFDFVRLHSVHCWNHQGWYKLAHTCRRWRLIVFSSPSRLNLQLYCTYGSPVAKILKQSPPLPLIVDYGGRWPLPEDDEEGALLALQRHDRIRYIDLHAAAPTLDKLLAVMNRMFPVLEVLALSTDYPDADEDDEDEDESNHSESVVPRLPPTFQAPHLRSLDLNHVGNVGDQGLPLLASLSDLVSLALIGIPVSIYLPLEYLVSRLSLMPRLEYLGLIFNYYISANDSLREQVDGPITKRISLPNLLEIPFQGESSYLEGLAARIIGNAPLLTNFSVTFLEEPSSILSHLARLLSTATELKLPVASIKFSGTRVDEPNVTICMAKLEQTLDRWPHFAPFQMVFLCNRLNVQVASAGDICAAFTPMLSAVEILHLDLDGGRWEFGPDDDIEDERWYDLLRPFCNVEKLQVDAGLIKDISVALRPNENGPIMGLLPKLCRLTRPDYTCFGDSFDGFIASRRDAGKLITKRRRPPIPYSDSEEDEDEDEDESDIEEDEEDEGGEGWDERGIVLRIEEEREGTEEGDCNTDSETDLSSGTMTSGDLGHTTELDSDSELDSEYCVE